MGRSRSRSYSPTRRDRSRSPLFRKNTRRRDDEYGGGARRRSSTWRGREFGGRNFSAAPTSLLVRNIARDSRPEDVRIPFERFGPVKDVYLPKDYYSGVPRGFGFIQYLDPADAADAQYYMDRQFIAGREITVVFAEENRKKPSEMRVKDRSSTPTGRGVYIGGRVGDLNGDKYRKQSSSRRFKSMSRSYSPPAKRYTSRKHGPPGSSPKKSSSPEANGQRARKSFSRSFSPQARRSSASKSHSLE